MTPEKLKQNAAAMIAFSEGKPIEYTSHLYEGGWGPCTIPIWAFKDHDYRPKLEPVTRRWNCASDIPVGPCYLRNIGSFCKSWNMIVSAGIRGVNVCNEDGVSYIPYKELDIYQASTDLREWRKCEVVEA